MPLRRQRRRRTLLRQQFRPLRLLDLHRRGKGQSIDALIAAGHEDLLPLADFRNRLKTVSENPDYRSNTRRNGQPGLGPLTFEARALLLEELLAIREETGMPLISDHEVRLIREQWAVDQSENSYRELVKISAIQTRLLCSSSA